jgi:hypothetical protein
VHERKVWRVVPCGNALSVSDREVAGKVSEAVQPLMEP